MLLSPKARKQRLRGAAMTWLVQGMEFIVSLNTTSLYELQRGEINVSEEYAAQIVEEYHSTMETYMGLKLALDHFGGRTVVPNIRTKRYRKYLEQAHKEFGFWVNERRTGQHGKLPCNELVLSRYDLAFNYMANQLIELEPPSKEAIAQVRQYRKFGKCTFRLKHKSAAAG